MSLSNPTLTNPAQHFFEWAGSKGVLQWYDKENKKNVLVRLPFEFIVLDQLNTIVGFNKLDESGFWSNEVRNIMNDELFVRTKRGPFEAGVYANLTQTMKKGGKFCKSVYIAHKGPGGEWIIGCFKASGSALSAWIEFTKTLPRGTLEGNKVVMEKGEVQTAQTGDFFPPKFKIKTWAKDEYEAAVSLDKELQVYLSQYLSAPKVDEDAQGADEPAKATPEQVADFENRKAAKSDDGDPGPQHQDDIVIEDIGDEPINLDDIPF